MKKIILLLILITIITKLQAQNNWKLEKKSNIINTDQEQLSEGYLIKTDSRDYFAVKEGTRERIKTRKAEVSIYKSGSRYKLLIEDIKEEVICEKVRKVIETQLSGKFRGYSYKGIYIMENGSIWQQISRDRFRDNHNKPAISLYELDGDWFMKVEKIEKVVKVERLR